MQELFKNFKKYAFLPIIYFLLKIKTKVILEET